VFCTENSGVKSSGAPVPPRPPGPPPLPGSPPVLPASSPPEPHAANNTAAVAAAANQRPLRTIVTFIFPSPSLSSVSIASVRLDATALRLHRRRLARPVVRRAGCPDAERRAGTPCVRGAIGLALASLGLAAIVRAVRRSRRRRSR